MVRLPLAQVVRLCHEGVAASRGLLSYVRLRAKAERAVADTYAALERQAAAGGGLGVGGVSRSFPVGGGGGASISKKLDTQRKIKSLAG